MRRVAMRLAPEIAETIAEVPGVKSASRNVFTTAPPEGYYCDDSLLI